MRRGSRKDPFPNELKVLEILNARGKGSTADVLTQLARMEDRPMNAATVYRVVNRLTKAGLVTQEWELPDDDEPQRAHRVFQVTAEGRAAIKVAAVGVAEATI